MLSSEPSGTEALECPRCHSQDTKFCYYNNYSTAQPRHFCKNCKRYWTAGGSLRSVPVGGGLRKNKKSKYVNELLSTSTHENFILANSTPLLMASPSFSVDGVVDESNVHHQLHLHWYGDSAAQAVFGGDNIPVSTPHFHYPNVRDSGHIHGNTLAIEDHQMPNQSGYYRFHQPNLRFMGVEQASSSSSEICQGVSEFPQASQNVSSTPRAGFPALVHVRYQTENLAEGVSHAASKGQGKLQCFAEDSLSQEGQPRVRSMAEDEDEELGNVINVRYPYDWDQVSEVLFGTATDLLQMPSF